MTEMLALPSLRSATREELAAELLKRLPAWPKVAEHHKADTPQRFVQMLVDMTTPTDYDKRFKTFPSPNQDMITLAPIPFYTLCAHHVVPFYGHSWVSYVPSGHIAGLSKFARAIRGIAKGLWVQEELTAAIADYLEEKLTPLGVGVVMKAEHLCMAMRGIETADVITTTSSMRGVYADHSRTAKAEFLAIVNGR